MHHMKIKHKIESEQIDIRALTNINHKPEKTNKYDLRTDLKLVSKGASLTFISKLFQSLGAAPEKDRPPLVLQRQRGTVKRSSFLVLSAL